MVLVHFRGHSALFDVISLRFSCALAGCQVSATVSITRLRFLKQFKIVFFNCRKPKPFQSFVN